MQKQTYNQVQSWRLVKHFVAEHFSGTFLPKSFVVVAVAAAVFVAAAVVSLVSDLDVS